MKQIIYFPLVLAACLLAGFVREAKALPNIVVIFIDDMGYGDIGPFGNTVYQTPNLDRMATEGNVLRDFYVSSVACTPSRSSLMTGCYAERIGMNGEVNRPGEPRGLNPTEVTLAELLKSRGYVTGCFGKWHLGDQPQFMPLAQGFDEYFGIPYSNDMWPPNNNKLTGLPHPPLPVMRGTNVVAHVRDGTDQSLLCEAYTTEALTFIENHQNEPFFLYFPNSFVHAPRYVRPEILAAAGGDILRAQVEEVDASVGRILDKLVELSIATNTLVLFTSDNGPASGYSAGPLRGGKSGNKYEGNMRVPTLTWWPGTIAAGLETTEIAETIDLLPTFAALTGAAVPADRIIDGVNSLDVLLGVPGAVSLHTNRYYGTQAIRQGNWKYLNVNGGELYNLATDIGESANLASSNPSIVSSLNSLLVAHNTSVAANTRPSGNEPNPVLILPDATGVPTLAEYVGYYVPLTGIVLMDDTINDGSFESTGSTGTVRVEPFTSANIGTVWIYANNGPANTAGRFNTGLAGFGNATPYNDNNNITNTVTSINLLGTSGYNVVKSGDLFNWSFDSFAVYKTSNGNVGTKSFGGLSLSFDGGANWILLATIVDDDQNTATAETATGGYVATAQNAADAATHGLRVRGFFADVYDPVAGGNANVRFDNVRLSVVPVTAKPAVVHISPGAGGLLSISGSNLTAAATYTLQSTPSLTSTNWQSLAVTSGVSAAGWTNIVAPTNSSGFFRMIGE